MTSPVPPRTLLIACGALAREVLALIRLNGWSHMELACLPAHLHNRPQRIPAAVRAKIRKARPHYARILVLYGDCGTGGALDQVLAEEGVERIPGPHCYAFYSGIDDFLAQAEAEPACFYLTDYLVRHFRASDHPGPGARPASRAAAAVLRQLREAGLPRADPRSAPRATGEGGGAAPGPRV